MNNTVFLNTNREMPLLGLGVYKATGENEAENAVISAVESGYRLIDTASVYKNEENVGRGIARCGVPRSELFITSKVWNTAQRLGDIQGAFERSLDRLKLDYTDPLACAGMLHQHLESTGRYPEDRTRSFYWCQQF